MVSFFNNEATSQSTSKMDIALNDATEDLLAPTLIVSTSPGMEPLITNPVGLSHGIDVASGIVIREIPETDFELDQNGGGFRMQNPLQGVYTVTLDGRVERDYKVTITFTDSDGFETTAEAIGYNHDDVVTFNFILNSSSTPTVNAISPVAIPTGIILNINANGKVALNWNSAGGQTTGYNIYRLAEGNPWPIKIAEVDATGYVDTNSAPGQSYLYAICAKSSTNSRSFFSEYVRSDDRDNDGLTDDEELFLGTDPAKFDTDEDSYSDYSENAFGSDPLDDNSKPTYPADFDQDRDVDGSDLKQFISFFNESYEPADINGDGIIDSQDIQSFAVQMGSVWSY